MTNEEVDRLLEQAVQEAAPNELYKYAFARLVAAAEHQAVLDTIDELMGMERERHPMFSEGYDHALLHLKEFVSARGKI